MAQTKYQIYELSARAVISYAKEVDGRYAFDLDRSATSRCMSFSSNHEQEGNALFYQIMCELYGDSFEESDTETVIPDLSTVIFYMNFEGIFDRSNAIRRKKAEAMFRPEGVSLDLGDGSYRYLAFERSGNMSRQSRLSFLREDLYEAVRRRIMLDMKIGKCQLAKLYAYNGLMLSSGVRVDDIGIDRPSRVIVVEDIKKKSMPVRVISVSDDGSQCSTRTYHREEKTQKIEYMPFDGEGLISRGYARTVDTLYCGHHVHSSFQIRMPYVKGMLHEVDFKDYLKTSGMKTITDIWGNAHRVEDVDIILTRSMFKGFNWLQENEMTWDDYWKVFRKYRHALYIINVSKEKPEQLTELNYQFLNTVSIRNDEFRPADLLDGWNHSPEDDPRHWLTKDTEVAYYNLCASREQRLEYFLKILKKPQVFQKSREYLMAEVLSKNPLFVNEPVFAKELEDKAEQILKKYSLGRLTVKGQNRFLSGDLMELLVSLGTPKRIRSNFAKAFHSNSKLHGLRFLNSEMFEAPGAAYESGNKYTLLRNPHIARNEEIQLGFFGRSDYFRDRYFSHLTDIVMVEASTLAAERLGGADYDGDMVKIIADPILNKCVRRNYLHGQTMMSTFLGNLPLLVIPNVEPQLRDADDWYARFETVRDTFSSRVGQICNAALDRSIIAYNENSDAEERQRCREETEMLAILTGLEIDSAKSGVRPDLSEYLGYRTVERTPFLRYKNLVEASEKRRAWYEPTHEEKIKKFFEETDWDEVDSNVERLPYLAAQLKKNTPRIKPVPAKDSELFSFAVRENWKDELDSGILGAVEELLRDYEACLNRIRACRVPMKNKQRKTDIDRILYARGQEERYDSDELYALLQPLPAERISLLRRAIREEQWHLLRPENREDFLVRHLPELAESEYLDLFADFRNGGYRILGDLVCDIDDENRMMERKKLLRETDSAQFCTMMTAYVEKPFAQDYRKAVSVKCRELLNDIVKPSVAVRYVVALGKRDLLWDLLIDQIERNVLRREEDRRAE